MAALSTGDIKKAESFIGESKDASVLAGTIGYGRAPGLWANATNQLLVGGSFTFKDLPRYGNWGGLEYSGGRSDGSDGTKKYINSMDKLFYEHDMAYKLARTESALKGAATIRKADSVLVKGLEGLNRSDLSHEQLYRNIDDDWKYRNSAIKLFKAKIIR
mgnify:FL=1